MLKIKDSNFKFKKMHFRSSQRQEVHKAVVVNFGAEYALKPSLGTVDTVGTCPPIYFQYLVFRYQ